MSLISQLISEDFTLINDGRRFQKTVEHSSLVLDNEKNLFYWNSKGLFGNCFNYLIKVRGYSTEQALEYLKSTNFLFDTAVAQHIEQHIEHINLSLVDAFYEYGKKYREYWYEKRGYTDKTIDDFKLGFTSEWYTIPIFEQGKFVNFQIRKELPKKAMKHWYSGVGPHSFNFGFLKLTDWVIIAEGPPDAIMLRQNNLPGISQTGGSQYWNPEWMPLFNHIQKIYIVYDNDDAGKIGAKKIASLFGKKAVIYTFDGFPPKADITDFFKSGHTTDELMSLLLTESKYEYEI